MSGISTMRKGNPMNRKLASAIAMSTATVFAAAAATLVTLASAHADDITVEQAPLASTLSREEVNAELKTPYVGGNPWSGSYDMRPRQSTASPEQLANEYMASREHVRATTAEDSGSAYPMKFTPSSAAPATVMGGATK
jgi:hypothetical protein